MAPTIPFEQALRVVATVPCSRLAAETVPLELALGRHLAEDLCTTEPWPPTDRSAMDGFAVRAAPGLAAGTRLPVVGESRAGQPFDRTLAAGEAIRIMTGAVVPAGADTVVPVEQTGGFGGVEVEFRAAVEPGRNIRPAGSEARAGQRVLERGRRIGAAEIGALAVLGRIQVPVVRRPRVAILATGDEVVPVTAVPLPHQVRESNSWAIAAQVRLGGGEPERLGTAPDEAAELCAVLQRGLEQADVLVTIGGISKGSHDLVHDVLAGLSVVEEFHGIDLKPGKPTYFGCRRGPERTVFVFGLPGNPASCFAVFDLLVRPLLRRLVGAPAAEAPALARLRGSFRPNSRLQAIPARLRCEHGELLAELSPPAPSGDPFSLLLGDAHALVPPQAEPGTVAEVPVVGYAGGIELP